MESTSQPALAPAEKIILQRLTKPEPLPEVSENATASELWQTLRAYAYLDKQLYRLRPLVGKILLRFQDNPELYKELGYADFTDFLERGVQETLGIRRSVRYEALQLARKWGDEISADDFAAIGPKKMRTLNEFANGKSNNRRKLIEAAKTMTVEAFAGMAREKFAVTTESVTSATIRIFTTQEIAERWAEFVANPGVQKHIDSADHGRILEAMIIAFEQEILNDETNGKAGV